MAVFDYVLDNGLQSIIDSADYLYFCSQEPTTYAQATSSPGGGGYALASAHPGVGNVISGGIQNATPDGRKVSTATGITGTGTTAGTIAAWAIIASALSGESRLMATGTITPQAIGSGQSCAMNSVDVRLPAVSSA